MSYETEHEWEGTGRKRTGEAAFAGATGSLPASSAEILKASCTLEIVAEELVAEGANIMATQAKEMAWVLRNRAEMARANERQPEENNPAQTPEGPQAP